MARGWICLHRDITDHWIFEKPEYLRAWVIMLMEVNHKNNKAFIKGKLLHCRRGESVMSHESWAQAFGKGWNRHKVRRFFKHLENDHMITQVNEQVTTRLTVCNYTKYQDQLKDNAQVNAQHTAHSTHTKRTQPNNDNNVNNKDKGAGAPKFNFKTALLSLGVKEQIASDWLKVRAKKKAANTETAFNRLAANINRSGRSANDCIMTAVERSWAGFDPDWLSASKAISGPHTPHSASFIAFDQQDSSAAPVLSDEQHEASIKRLAEMKSKMVKKVGG